MGRVRRHDDLSHSQNGRRTNAAQSLHFSREHWEWNELADCVADLKAAQPKLATQNFLFLYANPGDVDWFDDAGWREIVDHWRLLARAAREGGLRGILYDAEPYTPPHSQFLYGASRKTRNTPSPTTASGPANAAAK